MSQKFGAYTDQYSDRLEAFALGVYAGVMQVSRFVPVDTNNEIQQSQDAGTMDSDDLQERYLNVPITTSTEEELVVSESQREAMQRLEDILTISAGEVFEPGVESEFTKALTEAVKQCGSSAIRIIANDILGGIAGPTVASEVLCIVGDMDDAVTHDDRLSLLITALSSKSSRIRVGAILGLSRLGDLRSMDYLKAAREHEPYEFLQQYISQVMHVLEGLNCEDI